MEKGSRELTLTFDMDWANDDVLRYFHELICECDVCGTLHVTHETPVLDEIRREGRLELGIHPNFNKLLEKSGGGDFRHVICELLDIVPEAKSIRSHSLVRGSLITRYLAEHGLEYESNVLYDVHNGGKIRSFRDVWGMLQVPFIFEDDVFLLSKKKHEMEWYLSDEFEAPRVFNFHPIHLFLNTENMERYEAARQYTGNYDRLKQFRNTQIPGVENIFRRLVDFARKEGFLFRKMKETEK